MIILFEFDYGNILLFFLLLFEGCESRKLAVALNIIHLPPVIVLDDPTDGLDAISSLNLMSCIRGLSEAGHTVICSVPSRPQRPLFDMADHIVLISSGYSIYSGEEQLLDE